MRLAVETLAESSSKLWVSLFIVSTLMSGLPSVTPRRPGNNTDFYTFLTQLFWTSLYLWICIAIVSCKNNICLIIHTLTNGVVNNDFIKPVKMCVCVCFFLLPFRWRYRNRTNASRQSNSRMEQPTVLPAMIPTGTISVQVKHQEIGMNMNLNIWTNYLSMKTMALY